jgi:molybdenum cofactor sulfurtransferase
VCLARLWVYPIKSCAGFEPATCWPLGPNGLLLDREWALVDADGAALTLKKVPKLATIKPVLDLQAGARAFLSLSDSIV